MLNFKKIEISDVEIFREFQKKSNEISCENAFVNLFVWQKLYNNMFAVENGSLFIKSEEDGIETFRLPLGGDMEKGLKAIFEYHKGEAPEFWNPVGESFHRLPQWFSEKYDFHENRDAFDYIYRQSDLSQLVGKKYHSKRNHISAFSKKHSWEYERITLENLEDVIECCLCWYKENESRRDRYMDCEKEGILEVLKNMEKLYVLGGAIRVDGKIVAFTLGSQINENVFDIHFEKALSDFSEAYTVINREFAARELGDYKYINREDDLGLEGLRKAKLSYKPEILLKKYHCIPKENV